MGGRMPLRSAPDDPIKRSRAGVRPGFSAFRRQRPGACPTRASARPSQLRRACVCSAAEDPRPMPAATASKTFRYLQPTFRIDQVDAMARAIEEDGFALIPGVLSPAEVAQ